MDLPLKILCQSVCNFNVSLIIFYSFVCSILKSSEKRNHGDKMREKDPLYLSKKGKNTQPTVLVDVMSCYKRTGQETIATQQAAK